MLVSILILEDDRDLAAVFARELTEQGFVVATFQRIADFRRQLGAAPPDLCIVDLGLPDGDGLALLKDELGRHGLPIVIVSGRGALDDRLQGLESGADDYLVKPFAMDELLARLQALSRRGVNNQDGTTRLQVQDLVMDLLKQDVSRRGLAVLLQPREYKLLEYLMRHAGQVVTRTMLLEHVWGYNFDPQTNVIDVHVSRLRQKIDKDFDTSLLLTVRGAGYRLGPEAQ